MIAIDFTDSGHGMDADTLDRVFEPFFTTKGTGKGTGLGLSQVYGFASQSGGEVRAESQVGKGTTVSLLLPCGDARNSDEADAEDEPTAPGHRTAAILVVEDNEEVGVFAESSLSELGHRVTRAFRRKPRCNWLGRRTSSWCSAMSSCREWAALSSPRSSPRNSRTCR